MINTWLIDLDGTLYKDTDYLYDRIFQFLANRFSISLEKATTLSNMYLDRYGSTLAGLIKIHDIDPEYYLSAVYDEASVSHISSNTKLRDSLALINGEIIVFSNSTEEYAWRILNQLSISSHVDEVCDIRKTNYFSKPNPISFQHIKSKFNIVPNNTIMIDDRTINLKQAKCEGMITVLCGTKIPKKQLDKFIDYQIDSIERGLEELLDHVNLF